jgi:hypothetical protein
MPVLSDLAFAGASNLWQSLQAKLAAWVNEHEGKAVAMDFVLKNPDRSLVERSL